MNILIAAFLPEILQKTAVPFYQDEVRAFFMKIFKETVDFRRKEKIIRKDFMNLLMQLMEHGEVQDDEKLSDDKTNKGNDCEKFNITYYLLERY